MRNFLLYLVIALLSFGLVVNEVSAKRFGGGRSFGVQRSKSSLFPSHSAQNTKSFGQQQAAGSKWGKWGGALGGLLIGGLLGSLLMSNGLASGLLSWLVIGVLGLVIFSFLRKRMQPGFQSAHSNAFRQSSFDSPSNFSAVNSGTINNETNHSSPSSYPEGFAPEAFLRDAKTMFIRLQAAYDQKNLSDLSDFTAPEVFAEIKMQLDERGDEPNKTEVINLNAELLDAAKQAGTSIASVRFTGFVKENDELVQLDEIWHFRQFYSNSKWVVGGIQQEVFEP
jgi:predicted lipid-binding transport protein (Tim44 family)